MAFLPVVLGFVDENGKRIDAPNADGSHVPSIVRVGTGLGATNESKGSTNEVTLFAASAEFRWTAACSPSLAVGDLVVVDSSVPGPLTVQRVDVATAAKMPAAGIVVDKPNIALCVVVSSGIVSVSGLTPGGLVFASRSGGVSSVPPTADIGPAFVQVVGVALSATRALIQLPSTMIELAP